MSGTVLTNKGLALITKLVAASTELQISRVAVGTGRVPSGVDPQTMVDLNEYKMDAQIESYGVSPDQSDVAYIAAQVSSIGVSAGFAVTEAGVFATDPDVGEILYAYLDLTEDPQYIYAETDAISKFAEITFNVLIGSVAKVTAYVSPGALTKKVDFNAFKESVETPEFDDSGTVEGISSFPTFLETMKSKMNFFQFFRNLKAGLQFVLHAGQIVNNCVTDNDSLPLSAAQGKVLKDLYTQLYSEMGTQIYKVPDNETLDQLMKHVEQWGSPFTFGIGYTSPIAPAKNNAVGIAEREMLHAFDYSGRHFYCVDASKGWQTSPYALKSNYLTKNDAVIANQVFAVGLTTLEVTDKIPAIPNGYERIASILYTTQNYLIAQLAFTADNKCFLTVNNYHPSLSIKSDIRCVQLYRLKN